MTMQGRRAFLQTLSVLGGGAALASGIGIPGRARAAVPLMPITLGEAKGAGQSAQFALGIREGIFKAHHLDATLKLFDSGAAMGPALVAGSLSIIATGDIPAIPIFSAGAPVKALCPLSDFSSDQAIVVSKKISKATDLEGRKIALFKGSVASLLIEQYMRRNGGDISKVHLINMPPPQQLAALAAGEIDGYVSWEPFIWTGVKRIPGAHVLARGNEPHHYIHVFDLLVVRDDYLKSHANEIRDLLASLATALEMLRNASPAQMAHIAEDIRAVEKINLPTEVLVGMMKKRRYTMTIDKTFIAAQATNTKFLKGMGKIGKEIPVTSWLDTGPLRAVRPDLVKI